MKKHSIALTTALLCVSSTYAAIVEESFDYSTGNITSGTLSGGTGFSGAWITDDSGSGVPAIDSGLSMTGVTSIGNSVDRSSTGGWSTLSRGISGSSQTALQANTSMWFSTIINFKDNNNTRAGFMFGTDALDTDAFPNMSDSSGSGFGFRFGTSDGSRTNYEKIYAMGASGGTTTLSTSSYDTGSTAGNYFIVGQIDSSTATDVLNLYVFAEGDAITIAGAPDATLSLALDTTTFDTVSWNDNQNHGIDEIRLGTDFASVIPEPSSYALIAGMFGLTSVMIRRRR